MERGFTIREFRGEDTDELNRLSLRVFSEYREHYEDWKKAHEEYSDMARLAREGTILVALDGDILIGGVAYIGPGTERMDWYEPGWAYIRSLVVDPAHRGRGIGTRLTEACIELARRDGVPMIALVTSPVMAAAARIYEKLGFRIAKDLGVVWGFRLYLYCLDL